MNFDIASARKRLKRSLAKGPADEPLIDVVLTDSYIQELAEEYVEAAQDLEDALEISRIRGFTTESAKAARKNRKAAWSILMETANDRLELIKEGIQANKTRKGGSVAQGDDAPDGATLRDPEVADLAVDVLLYQGTFVGPESGAIAEAMSERLSWRAAQDPRVVRFREQVLAGRTLTESEASGLMGSYAARFLPPRWFSDWGIPVVDHASEVVGEYDWGPNDGDVDHRVTVRVDPPGIVERLRYAHPDTPILDEDRDQISRLCALTASGSVIPPFNLKPPVRDDSPEDTVEVQLASEKGERRVRLGPVELAGNFQTPSRPWTVWPGSVIGALYSVARGLSKAYPWVDRDAIALFVLTGSVLPIGALYTNLRATGTGSSPGQPRINLDIPPWVPAEDVLFAYRRMRRLAGAGGIKLPGQKTFQVARFVWEQERLNGFERLSWPVLCDRWNAAHPEGPKFNKWRSFRACAKRGEAATEELVGF